MSRRGTRSKQNKPKVQRALTVVVPSRPVPSYSSAAYEAIQETRKYKRDPDVEVTANRSRSLAWDDTEAVGMDGFQRQSNGMTDRERKETLYQCYVQIPWVSSCVEAISSRMVSGGIAVVPDKRIKGSDQDRDTLLEFFDVTNEEWDFLQFIKAIADDLGIYGEAYAELVCDSQGVPVAIYKIDCMSMTYQLAPNGKILEYRQTLEHAKDYTTFQPEEIIRWWLPSKKAQMIAEAPIERLLNSIAEEQNMTNWTQMFFKKGSKPPYWIETAGDMGAAKRFVKYLKDEYTGIKNANVPIVTFEGAKLHEYSKGTVDIDFPKGRQLAREAILSVMGVPPAMVGLIESGNIGGGTGESQSLTFVNNTVNPRHRTIFEKLNYRVTRKGFGIRGWKVTTHYAEYRSAADVVAVQKDRIQNGLATPDEERQESGREPYPDGIGATPIIIAGKDVVPLSRISSLDEEQSATAAAELEHQQAQTALTNAQAEKLKEPTPQPIIQHVQGGNVSSNDAQKTATRKSTKEAATGATGDADWQNTDKQVLQRLASALRNKSTHWTWETSPGACDSCLLNANVKRRIGETFPNGCIATPGHGNCDCRLEESREENNVH